PDRRHPGPLRTMPPRHSTPRHSTPRHPRHSAQHATHTTRLDCHPHHPRSTAAQTTTPPATLRSRIHCVIYGFKSDQQIESNCNRAEKKRRSIITSSKDGISWKLSIASLFVRL